MSDLSSPVPAPEDTLDELLDDLLSAYLCYCKAVDASTLPHYQADFSKVSAARSEIFAFVSRLRSQVQRMTGELEAAEQHVKILREQLRADALHLDWLNENYIGADFHYDWAGEEMSVMLIRIPFGKRVSADLRDTVRRLSSGDSETGDTKP